MGVFPLISGVGLIFFYSVVKNPRVSLEQDLSRLRFLLADLEFVAELGSAVKWHIVLKLLNLFKKYHVLLHV